MKLDSVTAELRPRNAWEAADLGARLVRRDAGAIYKTWFATSLPLLGLALAVIYFSPWPGAAFLLYWWLEPILDGPILDIIARRLFGGDADVKSTLRSVPRLAWQNRLFWLTPWRLHFARSTAMPLTQLEGLSGAARRRRAKVLNNSVLNHGIGVTAVYQHLVIVVSIGILLLALFFVPAAYQDPELLNALPWLYEAENRHGQALNLVLFYVAQSMLEPWFVGAGFGLYINCRTRLEAWDIEVAFRRMVARRQPAAAIMVLLLFGMAGFAAWPGPAGAEGSQPVAEADPGFAGYWLDEEFRAELERVMADDAFDQYETEERWVSKNRRDRATSTDSELKGLEAAFEQIALFLSFLAEFGLWALAGLLLLWLYVKRDLWLPYFMVESRQQAARSRVVLSTGEITAAELPEDLPGRVRELWAAGRQREALSLLYRGSVFTLVERYGVRLPESATEGSCLEAVAQQASTMQSDFFREVVNAWVRLAYGARPPSDDTVGRLTRGWTEHYGGGDA